MSRTQKILEHLKSGYAVSSKFAFKRWDETRLAARIWDIRNKLGIKVHGETVVHNKKSFTLYSLEK